MADAAREFPWRVLGGRLPDGRSGIVDDTGYTNPGDTAIRRGSSVLQSARPGYCW